MCNWPVQVFTTGWTPPVGPTVGPLKPEDAVVIFHQGDSQEDCHYASLAFNEQWLSTCPFAEARQAMPFVAMLRAVRNESIHEAGVWLSNRATEIRNVLQNTEGGRIPCVASIQTRFWLRGTQTPGGLVCLCRLGTPLPWLANQGLYPTPLTIDGGQPGGSGLTPDEAPTPTPTSTKKPEDELEDNKCPGARIIYGTGRGIE